MAQVLVNPPANLNQNATNKIQHQKPLEVRLRAVIGDVAELGLKSKLDVPMNIFDIPYTAIRGGVENSWVIPRPGTLKPHQEINLQVTVQPPPPDKLRIHGTVTYEYDGGIHTKSFHVHN